MLFLEPDSPITAVIFPTGIFNDTSRNVFVLPGYLKVTFSKRMSPGCPASNSTFPPSASAFQIHNLKQPAGGVRAVSHGHGLVVLPIVLIEHQLTGVHGDSAEQGDGRRHNSTALVHVD